MSISWNPLPGTLALIFRTVTWSLCNSFLVGKLFFGAWGALLAARSALASTLCHFAHTRVTVGVERPKSSLRQLQAILGSAVLSVARYLASSGDRRSTVDDACMLCFGSAPPSTPNRTLRPLAPDRSAR